MLELCKVSGGYGHAPVVRNVDLRVERGETVALLGPNGAGKTTLLAALSGILPQRSGTVKLGGADVGGLPSHRIVECGLVQVPEGRHVFAPLSVEDNLRLGSVSLVRRDRARAEERFDFVYRLFPRLAERRRQLAGTLSGGEQQMVAIGRALMSVPRMLLLDEPFLGLAPRVVEEILAVLDRLRAEGLTMLLVEQKLDIALPFTRRAYVLMKGRIALAADSAELARRDDLAQLYFDLARQAA
ncbi:ABC transporter ATP-binding protein [Pigmentiphaga kullae]|uniref:Branched-chain amino acid transport system ATP-binding protein n=1 Tax=Pigmentiphaga kullae TaxID=151784 RepID=A0A4V2F3S5_9BURK|nr:ABC transporter ATP-binding protein [Pigmentiphaga kullae]RZS85127.1 branched-chain amino acid transport system ATP-binding protein [Pigmentiphaga kullae]